jgi:hypothetical protein
MKLRQKINPSVFTARTVQRQNDIKHGTYVCQRCEKTFDYEAGRLACPQCKTAIADDLIPYYTDESPESEMLSPADFAAGD